MESPNSGAFRKQIRAEAQARVGEVLCEKWTLDRLIAVGGAGAVFAATHRNGHRSAIKLLHPSIALVQSHVKRFRREAVLANKIAHPGIVRIFDDGVDAAGTPFFVMELLEGTSLDAAMAKGPMSPDAVVDIARQALDILAAAHAEGVLHRDLKPSNLIKTAEGVKILDFGIAGVREAAMRDGADGDDTLTLDGYVLGTPCFMPPEQARGRWSEMDASSDLWALGMTLCALLRGSKLRRAPTTQEELLCAMSEPLPPVRVLVPDVPERLAAVLDRAMAFDKKDRWQDARSMREALDAVEESAPEKVASVPPPAVSVSVRPPAEEVSEPEPDLVELPARRARWKVGAGGAALAGVVLFAWLSSRSEPSVAPAPAAAQPLPASPEIWVPPVESAAVPVETQAPRQRAQTAPSATVVRRPPPRAPSAPSASAPIGPLDRGRF